MDDLEVSLLPRELKVGLLSRVSGCLKTALMIPIGIAAALTLLCVFAVLTLTGVGPLLEYCFARRDKHILSTDVILKEHPEMRLLEIPGHINKASCGRPYNVMIRLTKPLQPPPEPLPPVIFPGGLAANLIAMSRHQDELTAKYGFTVVNFDRLGVGFSDPYPRNASISPSAADVAREMDYVMRHSGAAGDEKWIQVGGSMGTNVATAFVALFPGRLCGFFNLDGLPHAFLQVQCKKFLLDGKKVMLLMRSIRWTGLPRLAFSLLTRSMLDAMGTAFTPAQILGVMCRDQFFTATGLEYATLMSCCDLECAAWGPQATTEYDRDTMRIMATLAPAKSIVVDQTKGVARTETDERSESELGDTYLTRDSQIFRDFEARFRALALRSPEDVNIVRTHCNWPDPPRHPVGDLVGGIDINTAVHPLAKEFGRMVIRVMCARNYKGLERDYSQAARNHAAARTNLHVLMAADGKSYYYPRLNHVNLWQQSNEVVNITFDIASAVKALQHTC